MSNCTSSFLGANTPRGFVSFFDELYNPYKSHRAYIIKGGPGTGKSTLMKKIAEVCEKKDIPYEKVYCSSDPDSLDGIIVPSLSLCAADGTSPHVIEPRFPGACETTVNLGEFWDREKLYNRRDEIKRLTTENSLYHRRSGRYLEAAGSLLSENYRIASRYINTEKLHSFALRFTMRELPKKKNNIPGKRSKRFISAITPKGLISLDENIQALCPRLIAIDDEFTGASSLLCDMIGTMAIKNGYDVIFCHCPMKPEGECEHVIIPEKGIGIMTVKSAHSTKAEFDRIIHAKRFLHEGFRDTLPLLKLNRRLIKALTEESIISLKKAKETHNKLEEIYINAMDFSSLNAYCEKICDEIFGKY